MALEGLINGSLTGLGLNLGTEIIGAILTFALIDRVIGTSEEKKRLKTDLIAQLGSAVHEEAVRAAQELRRYGWLQDGSLRRASLRKANLQGVNLKGADLHGADLWDANLEQPNLWQANLKQTVLWEANLRAANLELANLQKANLMAADLQRANLNVTDLGGADLSMANLQGASFETASFDEHTTLPDGTAWVSGPDIWVPNGIQRFTDPDHTDFWRSDAPGSPAYQGKEPSSEP